MNCIHELVTMCVYTYVYCFGGPYSGAGVRGWITSEISLAGPATLDNDISLDDPSTDDDDNDDDDDDDDNDDNDDDDNDDED